MVWEIAIGAGIGAIIGGVAYPLIKDYGLNRELAGISKRVSTLEGSAGGTRTKEKAAIKQEELNEIAVELAAEINKGMPPAEAIKKVGAAHLGFAMNVLGLK